MNAAAHHSVSVVVPTYRRPQSLRACVTALLEQTFGEHEIILVRRADDVQTASAISRWSGVLNEVEVDRPTKGVALAAGVRRAEGDIIAFTDDDAVPRRDWLRRIVSHFEDPRVGGVGGRDMIGGVDECDVLTERVGVLTSWGKVIGNHHLGRGDPREVEVLKGVNMAFRREALAIPADLRGEGAQIHQEIGISLWARKRGWKLIYDPRVIVDHYPGPRFDANHRVRPESIAIRNVAYNYNYCLLSLEPGLLWRRALFGLLIGDREKPGFARAAVGVARRETDVLRGFAPSVVGQTEAILDVLRGRRVSMITFKDTVDKPIDT